MICRTGITSRIIPVIILEYNKYGLDIYLRPADAIAGKSAIIIEWEAGEKPDTLVTQWNKALEPVASHIYERAIATAYSSIQLTISGAEGRVRGS
ncbi:MAG: hypothetical protein LBF62_13325 [Tannerellaceae bacterium]|jgi:hypothetical protein|nr:hypothetical protein [Tannerellaceae bacterium]